MSDSKTIKYNDRVRISGCGWLRTGTMGYVVDKVREGWVRVMLDGIDYEDTGDCPLLSVQWLAVV